MNKHKFLMVLLWTAVSELTIVLLLFLLHDRIPPVSLTPSMIYVFDLVTALSLLASAYLVVRQRMWSPVLRLGLLFSSANLIVLDYFLFGNGNLLYGLPLLLVCLFVLIKHVCDD